MALVQSTSDEIKHEEEAVATEINAVNNGDDNQQQQIIPNANEAATATHEDDKNDDEEQLQQMISNDSLPNIEEFLRSNRLSGKNDFIIRLLSDEHISMEELLSMNEDLLLKYLTIVLKSDQPTTAERVTSKIIKLKKNRNMNGDGLIERPEININEFVIVVLSDEEIDAIKKLDQYNKNISLLIDELNEKSEIFRKNAQESQLKIISSFDSLKLKTTQKIQEINEKLKEIEKEKNLQINQMSEIINKLENNGKNAVENCQKLIENINMDLLERKQKILSITNDIINAKLPNDDINDIPTDIHLAFNDKNTPTFLDNLCSVNH